MRIAAREQRHDMPPLRGHHQLLAISPFCLPTASNPQEELTGTINRFLVGEAYVEVGSVLALHAGEPWETPNLERK